MPSREPLWWRTAELRAPSRAAASRSMMAARTASLLAGTGRPSRVATATRVIIIICVQPSPSNAQTPAILHSSIFLRDSARSFSNPGSLFDSTAPQLFSVAKPLDAKWEAAGLIRMICRIHSNNNVAYRFTARILISSLLV